MWQEPPPVDDDDEDTDPNAPVLVRRFNPGRVYRHAKHDGLWTDYSLCCQGQHYRIKECESLERSRVGGRKIIDANCDRLGDCNQVACRDAEPVPFDELPAEVRYAVNGFGLIYRFVRLLQPLSLIGKVFAWLLACTISIAAVILTLRLFFMFFRLKSPQLWGLF